MDRPRQSVSSRMAELMLWALSTTMAMIFGCIAVVMVFFFLIYGGELPSSFVLQAVFSLVAFVVGGVIGGSIVGGFQRYALRHAVSASWAGSWLRATTVSWSAAAVAWWLEYQSLGGTHFEISSRDVVPGIIVTGVLSGAIIGTGQWLLMRRQVAISFLWIAASTGSWLLASIICALVVSADWQGAYLIALLACGPVIALGMGLARPWLIDPTRRD
jgi:hypothetical protein